MKARRIPDGPAKIRWIHPPTKLGGHFVWESFPEHLRGRCDGDGQYTRFAVVSGWEALSIITPDVSESRAGINKLYCPGTGGDGHYRQLRWPDDPAILGELIGGINAFKSGGVIARLRKLLGMGT
jgi:hypothetical protein